jgi:hypothetical protein
MPEERQRFSMPVLLPPFIPANNVEIFDQTGYWARRTALRGVIASPTERMCSRTDEFLSSRYKGCRIFWPPCLVIGLIPVGISPGAW